MKWEKSNNKGYLLIEVILSITLFSILYSVILTILLNGQIETAINSRINEARVLAQEGLEVVRLIRTEDFANLQAGSYGLSFSNDQWSLVVDQEEIGLFTREIVLNPQDDNRFFVEVIISWLDTWRGVRQVKLQTEITNWLAEIEELCDPQSLIIDHSKAEFVFNNRALQGISISNIGNDCSVVLDKILLTWSNDDGLLTTVQIADIFLSDILIASGEIIDLSENILFSSGEEYEIYFEFDNDMTDNHFSFVFITADGSEIYLNNLNLYEPSED